MIREANKQDLIKCRAKMVRHLAKILEVPNLRSTKHLHTLV